VEAESVRLGFFTFSMFSMWRDLHPEFWSNSGLLDHPLVNMILGHGTEFENLSPLVQDDETIDHQIDISECAHVVDADSSQAIVIEEARIGRKSGGPRVTGYRQVSNYHQCNCISRTWRQKPCSSLRKKLPR
jgi:hypothetical protein